jgi:hypothetical protein
MQLREPAHGGGALFESCFGRSATRKDGFFFFFFVLFVGQGGGAPSYLPTLRRRPGDK